VKLDRQIDPTDQTIAAPEPTGSIAPISACIRNLLLLGNDGVVATAYVGAGAIRAMTRPYSPPEIFVRIR
jgi:hypothetical protein